MTFTDQLLYALEALAPYALRWLVGSIFVIQVYGLVLLFTRTQIIEELTNRAIDGSIWWDAIFAPFWIGGLLIAAFFYPVIIYKNSGRERKRLSRTLSPAR